MKIRKFYQNLMKNFLILKLNNKIIIIILIIIMEKIFKCKNQTKIIYNKKVLLKKMILFAIPLIIVVKKIY